jgi:hypothetical protein
MSNNVIHEAIHVIHVTIHVIIHVHWPSNVSLKSFSIQSGGEGGWGSKSVFKALHCKKSNYRSGEFFNILGKFSEKLGFGLNFRKRPE